MSDPPPQPISQSQSQQQPPPATLEYDRSPNHVTRGQFRILLFMMFINTVAIVGYVCVPGGAQWARAAWNDFQNKRAAKAAEQRKRDALTKRIDDFRKMLPQLAAMKLPADTPVYTEDGIEAASLLASDPAYQTVQFERHGLSPGVWQVAVGRAIPAEAVPLHGFVGGDPNSARGIWVSVHTRKNPKGEERLVLCELEASQQVRGAESNAVIIGSDRSLIVRLIAPGSATDPPKALAFVQTEFNQRPDEQAKVKTGGSGGGEKNNPNAAKTPQTFRLFTGVADPSDATRLKIPYLINGAAGSFAVRIVENDRLVVEPSEGRIAERNAAGGGARVEQTWDPTAPPAVHVSESRP